MAITKEEKTIQLMFSYCGYIPKIKLNNEWQMFTMSKNINIIDKIALLITLQFVQNFKPYNKSIFYFSKKLVL